MPEVHAPGRIEGIVVSCSGMLVMQYEIFVKGLFHTIDMLLRCLLDLCSRSFLG